MSSVPAEIIINKHKHFMEIPYKGVSQAIVDLLGGHIDATFISGNPTDRPELTLLANTSLQPFQGVPSWTKCLGIDKTVKGQFLMIAGPTANKEFVKKMKQLVLQFVNDPDTIEYFKNKGFDSKPSMINNVDKLVKEEYNLL
jgi:tripartite-type tricarboxylate transporter receptor subunit TctC